MCLPSFGSSLGSEKCPFTLKYYTEAGCGELTNSRGNQTWTLEFSFKI